VEPARVIALEFQDFLERRHRDERVDAVMRRRLEPRRRVPRGQQVAMEIDDDPPHLRPRHRAAEVGVRPVVIGKFRRRLGNAHGKRILATDGAPMHTDEMRGGFSHRWGTDEHR
jgi:hypothetical protein